MTIKRAAKLLGSSEWVVRHMCLSGRIPAVKRRTHWFIPEHFREIMNQRLLESFDGFPNQAMSEAPVKKPRKPRKSKYPRYQTRIYEPTGDNNPK